jgi:hypothetical protein
VESKLGDQPAFPQTIDDMGTIRSATSGLSRRELFAGMAMQALLMHGEARICRHPSHAAETNAQVIADSSVFMADALLKQLDGGK